MNASRHVPCLVAVITLTVATAVQAKPKIEVLATGGTIAGAQASSSEVGYKSGTFSVDDDDKLGFIASMELSPQKARILLMLALMNTNDPAKLQQVFMQY